MSTVIQIKRSSGSTAPTTSDLLEGEMAYAQDAANNGAAGVLYIESLDSSGSATIDAIGGKKYTAAVDAATNSNTASTIVKRDASGNFSAGTITADLTGDVTGTVSSISNHDTDALSEGSSNLYFTDSRARNAISVSGDLSYDPSTGVISYTDPAFSLSGFDTDDLVEGTSNLYYTDTRARNAISVTGSGTYDASTGVIDIQGGVTQVNGQTGSVTLDTDDVNEGTSNLYFTTARVDSHLSGGTGVDYSSGVISIGQDVSTTANVTFNDVTVDGTLNSDDITATNITVAGNLTVTGTTTTVNSTTISVTDPLIFVGNDNNASDAVDLGVYGMYDASGTDKYSGIFRDASDGKWRLFKDLQTAPTTTVNVSGTGYTVATLVANLEGSLSGGTVSNLSAAIGVADGGTGASSLTANGVLFGGGTSAIGATAVGTAGQVLLSNGSGNAPSFGNIDGGTY